MRACPGLMGVPVTPVCMGIGLRIRALGYSIVEGVQGALGPGNLRWVLTWGEGVCVQMEEDAFKVSE